MVESAGGRACIANGSDARVKALKPLWGFFAAATVMTTRETARRLVPRAANDARAGASVIHVRRGLRCLRGGREGLFGPGQAGGLGRANTRRLVAPHSQAAVGRGRNDDVGGKIVYQEEE
jgi:hypothetical protein